MLQIFWLDTSNRLTIVSYFGPWFNQSVKDDIAIKIDNRNPCKTITFLCLDSLAVNSQNFCLFASFPTLIQHSVEKNLVLRVGCLY